MTTSRKYSMTFTEGTLLLQEAREVARLYVELNDWKATRRAGRDQNILRSPRARTARTLVNEVVSRLSMLTPGQLDLLLEGAQTDQEQICWLAICKRYLFIEEFARDVVREKFLRLDMHLEKEDYERFFADKASWEENIDSLADSTRTRLRSNLFRMMREANIISGDDIVQPAVLSPAVVEGIRNDATKWLSCYPVAPISIYA